MRSIQASGMTNLNAGMRNAVSHRNGVNSANIIILLSDGVPTEGVTDWVQIRKNIADNNDGYFAIFTFAIGSSAPFEDLLMVSRMNNGKSMQIIDNSDTTVELKNFYDGVANPLIWNAHISYENGKKVILQKNKQNHLTSTVSQTNADIAVKSTFYTVNFAEF